MVQKMFFLCVIGILVSFNPAVMAQEQTMSEQEYQAMLETLDNCCSPEQQAWYEQQHELYVKEHPVTPLKRYAQFTAYEGSPVYRLNSGVDRILMIINQNLYSNQTAKQKIDRYIQDVGNGHGCEIEVEILEGGSAEELKALFKSYYTDGGLNGVVQIGSFTPAWFFDADTRYGGNFTCDLFFEDLDGTWQDRDGNGRYDVHDPGSGDRAPEIFYGRIDPKTMGSFGTEVELLSTYMDKNHAYWTGQIPLKKSAFVQIEPDWRSSANYVDRIYGTANTEIIRGTGSRSDYLNNRLTKDYSFLHLWCHSGYTAHSFSNGGSLNYSTIVAVPPKPIGYAHDGCHCADWAAGNNRGFTVGAYVYNESPTALVAISGTKTGQWIGNKGQRFFEELGKNTCMGEAYKLWFGPYINSARDMAYFILWDYGYCIIGDPMMTFIERTTDIKKNTLSLANAGGYLQCSALASSRTVVLSYALPHPASVDLGLYNSSGKLVRTVVSGAQGPGTYSSHCSTDRLPAGVYVATLRTNSSAMSKFVHIVK
ncbi:MAG: hypothetical protein JW768_13155 [Chitinispirillaceae bacterium]|nr:hypothetical protein [Chitinispirillaceae bacterium]